MNIGEWLGAIKFNGADLLAAGLGGGLAGMGHPILGLLAFASGSALARLAERFQ